MDYGDHLNGSLGLLVAVWQHRSNLARVCGLGLLRPRVNGSLVCDESAAEGGMLKCRVI